MSATGLARLGRPQSIVLLLVLPLVYGAIFFGLRPAINNDSGMGFRALEAARQGAPFNTVSEPDPSDISKDVARFVAAWSPAQYQVPALFQIDGLDLGQAIALAATVCICAGIVGWYLLYGAMGFSPFASLLSCLIIEASRYFLFPLYQYDGGEVTLFAVAPWCVLLVWQLESVSGPRERFAFAGLAIALATYAKLSGFIFITAVLGGATVHCWLRSVRTAPANDRLAAAGLVVRTMAPGALAWLVCLAGFYVFWVARGATAVDRPGFHFYSLSSIYFPLVSTVVSAFGLSDALGVAESLGGSRFGWLFSLPVAYAVALPFVAAAMIHVMRRSVKSPTSPLPFILASGALYAAALIVLFNSGAALYLDDRFFRVTSLLLLPCLVEGLILQAERAVRLASWAFVAGLAGYGVLSGVQHVVGVDRWPVGSLGFRHPVASPGLLAYLRENYGAANADRSQRVVYVTSSEIPLEIRGARTIAIEADYLSLEALARQQYRGKVRDLTVVLPATFLANGKAQTILESFRDYDPARWTRRQIDDRFVAFRQ